MIVVLILKLFGVKLEELLGLETSEVILYLGSGIRFCITFVFKRPMKGICCTTNKLLIMSGILSTKIRRSFGQTSF